MTNFSALLEEMDDQMLIAGRKRLWGKFYDDKAMDFFSKNVLFTFSFYALQKTEAEKENEKTQKDTREVVEFASMN